MTYWVNVYRAWEGNMYFGTPYATEKKAKANIDAHAYVFVATVPVEIPEES